MIRVDKPFAEVAEGDTIAFLAGANRPGEGTELIGRVRRVLNDHQAEVFVQGTLAVISEHSYLYALRQDPDFIAWAAGKDWVRVGHSYYDLAEDAWTAAREKYEPQPRLNCLLCRKLAVCLAYANSSRKTYWTPAPPPGQ